MSWLSVLARLKSILMPPVLSLHRLSLRLAVSAFRRRGRVALLTPLHALQQRRPIGGGAVPRPSFWLRAAEATTVPRGVERAGDADGKSLSSSSECV